MTLVTYYPIFYGFPADKVNRDSVRRIQQSIFMVCLDAPMPRVSDHTYRSHVAGQMLHGGGGHLNSGNRWFDKTLQVSPPDALEAPAQPIKQARWRR